VRHITLQEFRPKSSPEARRWQLLWHAEIASRALGSGAGGKDQACYEGKIAAAQFFAGNVLPEITATRGILARTSTALMDLDDEAF
jgi:hypothetical protein